MKNTTFTKDVWNELMRAVDLCLRLLKENVAPPATRTTQANEGAEQQRSGHVLLSYNESTKALVQKLMVRLLESGLVTWIDEENTGSVSQSTADAVELSAVVFICCSSDCRWSDRCRK